MKVDLIFFGIVGLFALFGYFSGFWMQVVRLFVLALSYFLAGWVGSPIGNWISIRFQLPPMVGMLLGPAAAFFFLYVLFSILGWVVVRRIRAASEKTGGQSRLWDRLLGVLLGATKGFLILFILLCALVLLEKPLAKTRGQTVDLKGSWIAGMAAKHNLIAKMDLPVIGNVEGFSKLANDPSYREKVLSDPKIKRLLDHPAMQGLFNDPAVMNAAKSSDITELLYNPHLNRTLQDPELRELLSGIKIPTGEK
jgi:uncharacterized membrane protein required for colicin V production